MGIISFRKWNGSPPKRVHLFRNLWSFNITYVSSFSISSCAWFVGECILLSSDMLDSTIFNTPKEACCLPLIVFVQLYGKKSITGQRHKFCIVFIVFGSVVTKGFLQCYSYFPLRAGESSSKWYVCLIHSVIIFMWPCLFLFTGLHINHVLPAALERWTVVVRPLPWQRLPQRYTSGTHLGTRHLLPQRQAFFRPWRHSHEQTPSFPSWRHNHIRHEVRYNLE